MTGIVGGETDARGLAAMADAMYMEDWYERRRRETHDAGVVLVEHGTRDQAANVLWQGDRGVGVIYGVVSDGGRASGTAVDIFERFLDRPESVLRDLEGPFAIAAIDRRADRILLATDKAGSRPLYYRSGDRFRFGSEVTPLVAPDPDVTVDPRAVGDLLTYGYVVGERTLLREVSALPPATLLTADAAGVRTRRYWTPDVAPLSPSTYPDRWIGRFRRGTEDVAATADEVTLRLAGGLDGRIAGATLSAVGRPFDAATFGRPPGVDRATMTSVAEALGVDHRFVDPGEPDGLVEAIESSVADLPVVFDGLHEAADVVWRGGEFLDDGLRQHHLAAADTAVDALFRCESDLEASAADALVEPGYDPRASLRSEVGRSVGPTESRRALDAARRIVAYSGMRADAVQRSQVGTRVLAHGSVLDCTVRVPHAYRARAVPLARGSEPAHVPRGQLAVLRRLDRGLAEIPCDTTGLAPARPGWLHTVGLAGKRLATALSRTGRPATDRFREDGAVRRWMDRTIDDVRDRPFVDDDAVAALHSRFVDGASDRFPQVAALTGIECWHSERLDPVRRRGAVHV